MTFEIYLLNLIDYIEKHPESKKYQVVYAKDGEGNDFEVADVDIPVVGNYDLEDRVFTWQDEDTPDKFINALVINQKGLSMSNDEVVVFNVDDIMSEVNTAIRDILDKVVEASKQKGLSYE